MTRGFAAIALALVFALGLAAKTSAEQAEKRQTIFYNVTSSNSWSAIMAMTHANAALEQGYKVVIFLNARGVFIAWKNAPPDLKEAREQLKTAIGKGALVIICESCLTRAKLTKDDLIEGPVNISSKLFFDTLTADGTVTLSY